MAAVFPTWVVIDAATSSEGQNVLCPSCLLAWGPVPRLGWVPYPTILIILMWYPLHDCPWRWDLGRQGEDRGALIMWLASLQEEAQSAVLLSVPFHVRSR